MSFVSLCFLNCTQVTDGPTFHFGIHDWDSSATTFIFLFPADYSRVFFYKQSKPERLALFLSMHMYHNIKPLIPPQHLTSHSPIIMRFVKTNRKRTDLLKLTSIEIEMRNKI